MRKWLLCVMVVGGVGCAGGDSADDHGFVQVRASIADGQPGDLLVDTEFVEASLAYETCLLEFYEFEGANLVQNGPQGEDVFERWQTKLCNDVDIDASAPCDVVDIRQSTERLRVDYSVERIVENHVLAVGPIPLEQLADCPPVMGVDGDATLSGFDRDGTLLWDTSSWEPDEMAAGQNQAIVIQAKAPD